MQLLEDKVIRLVEERGYMGTKYIPVIREIIKYIEKYIQNNPKNADNGWKFYIPSNITEKIDCVETLWIEISITDKIDGYNHTGSGGNTVFPTNRIVNDKIELGKITIQGFSYGTNLFSHTIFGTLSHELNHLQETYKKLLRKMSSTTMYKIAVDQNTVKNYKFSDDDATNNVIQNIFYRLFFKNEFNALINSVYGDLETRNSVRKNFKRDIKYTGAYTIYKDIKKEINLFSDDLLEDDEWDNIMKCYNYISVQGAKRYSNKNNFKKRFRNHIISKLNQLMKGIGKVASFYYDNTEDTINMEPIEIIDPNVKLNMN
jgi:hypothetical protein